MGLLAEDAKFWLAVSIILIQQKEKEATIEESLTTQALNEKTFLKSTVCNTNGSFLIGFLDSSITVEYLTSIYGEPAYSSANSSDENDFAVEWILKDKANKGFVTLYLFNSEVDKDKYNIHIGGCSYQDVDLLKHDLPENKVIDKGEFYAKAAVTREKSNKTETPQGLKLKVYYNLHKNIFSIQKYSGNVLAYARNLKLRNAQFKVSEVGRQKVLKEQRKNVHAYCIGELEAIDNNADFELKSDCKDKESQFELLTYQ